MKDNFNFKRFGKYYLLDLTNIWNNAGMILLIFALFPIIFYLICIIFEIPFTGNLMSMFSSGLELEGPAATARLIVFVIMTMIFIMLYPSRIYGQITDKAKGSAWLMLPASRVEKFTSMILNCLILIPAVFLIVYSASDALVCLFDKTCGTPVAAVKLFGEDGLMNTGEIILTGNGIWLLLATIVEYASIFLLGALLFKKWKIIGTILSLFGIGMLFSVLLGVLLSTADMDMLGEWLENWVKQHTDNLEFYINLYINSAIGLYVIGCGIWSWFRIKRMQH